ncbi:hypothetical protein AB0F18_08785 [Streptomyces sp. NPDC029216]|uniref:hypothetical protein n=1 Tax=Streptomyces sp. NPDC029216 TaxID=3154701 RepID=UPI00340F1B68
MQLLVVGADGGDRPGPGWRRGCRPMNHPPADPSGTGKRKPWQRRLAIGAWVFSGLCVFGVLGMVLSVMYDVRQPAEREGRPCCWEENATPEWVAKTMGFQVPETATDRRAGLHTNVQYDVALLAFTVTTAEADRFLKPLQPEGTQFVRNTHPEEPGYTRSDGFGHLGLPEPETFVDGMRIGGFCRGDSRRPEGRAVQFCTNIYAHEFQPGTTRIYLRAGSDTPIEKPPA